MRMLGIDTSTAAGGLALACGEPGGERLEVVPLELPRGTQHSRSLLLRAGELLASRGLDYASLDRIAVAAGPGSFTGLRAGLAIANGLGFALGVPVTAIPSLEAFARAAEGRADAVVVLLDAFRGEVYAARFALGGAVPARLAEVAVLAPGEALRALVRPGDALLGDGVARYRELVAELAPASLVLDVGSAAGAVARLAAERPAGEAGRPALPLYARKLDDEPVLAR